MLLMDSLVRFAQAWETSQSLEVGCMGERHRKVDCPRFHLDADEPSYRRNPSALPCQGNIPKAGSMEALSPLIAVASQVRHNWGNWCCQAAMDCRTVYSADQTYWTSPGLPFFNRFDDDETSGIAAMIALL